MSATAPQPPGLVFVTADERLAAPSAVKAALLGQSGAGKTYAARTLPPATTLFIDGEAGTKALGEWGGRSLNLNATAAGMKLHPWELCRAVASLLSGPDLADYDLQPDGRRPGPYSPEMHAQYRAALGDPAVLFPNLRTIFVDSITVASRWSFAWANSQPDSISDKGKKDTRGAYGLHGREMVRWLTMLQHAPLNVVVAGILDKHLDDFKRVSWDIQVEGGKVAKELPGIFDNIITLARFDFVDGQMTHNPDGPERAMVCTGNPWGLPGKDRSGKLAMVEPPDLGALLAKMNNGRPIG
jgi:hypothetical protein